MIGRGESSRKSLDKTEKCPVSERRASSEMRRKECRESFALFLRVLPTAVVCLRTLVVCYVPLSTKQSELLGNNRNFNFFLEPFINCRIKAKKQQFFSDVH